MVMMPLIWRMISAVREGPNEYCVGGKKWRREQEGSSSQRARLPCGPLKPHPAHQPQPRVVALRLILLRGGHGPIKRKRPGQRGGRTIIVVPTAISPFGTQLHQRHRRNGNLRYKCRALSFALRSFLLFRCGSSWICELSRSPRQSDYQYFHPRGHTAVPVVPVLFTRAPSSCMTERRRESPPTALDVVSNFIGEHTPRLFSFAIKARQKAREQAKPKQRASVWMLR
ncbi:hypothetical protein F5884DRAFT_333001 [Xylogone sp. PMI_703]|nr:hypothetical protein F5884DRAFT_333001 [Xylogone sp. PMI_703]